MQTKKQLFSPMKIDLATSAKVPWPTTGTALGFQIGGAWKVFLTTKFVKSAPNHAKQSRGGTKSSTGWVQDILMWIIYATHPEKMHLFWAPNFTFLTARKLARSPKNFFDGSDSTKIWRLLKLVRNWWLQINKKH